MRLRFITVLLLLVAFATPALALPKPTGYVSDLAKLLTAKQEKDIKSWLLDYYFAQNLEIFVATVKNPSDSYAEKLLNYWHVGKPSQNNGLLLLINAQGDIGLGTGKLAQLYLKASDKRWLAKKVKAAHKGNLEQTIITTLGLIDQRLKQNQQTVRENYRLPKIGKVTVFFFFLSMVLLPWLGAILSRDRPFYGGTLVAALIVVLTFILVGLAYSLIVASFLLPLAFLLDISITNNYKKNKKVPAWWAGGRWLP